MVYRPTFGHILHVRVPRAYVDQSIHAQTIITFVFQAHISPRFVPISPRIVAVSPSCAPSVQAGEEF